MAALLLLGLAFFAIWLFAGIQLIDTGDGWWLLVVFTALYPSYWFLDRLPGADSTVSSDEGLTTCRLPDGTRKLLKPLGVIIQGKRYTVPEGFETDYSSIPAAARAIVAWSRVDIAGVVHDHLYETALVGKSKADWVWFQVARSGESRANILQASGGLVALWLFGWPAWIGHRYRQRSGGSD
ncbi:MAG: DUF1353 domain-containing protein [Pseudomonadota bacterium]